MAEQRNVHQIFPQDPFFVEEVADGASIARVVRRRFDLIHDIRNCMQDVRGDRVNTVVLGSNPSNLRKSLSAWLAYQLALLMDDFEEVPVRSRVGGFPRQLSWATL